MIPLFVFNEISIKLQSFVPVFCYFKTPKWSKITIFGKFGSFNPRPCNMANLLLHITTYSYRSSLIKGSFSVLLQVSRSIFRVMVSIFRVDLSNLCTNVSYFWTDLQMQATLEKASVTSQPYTENSYFLSQMNCIECTFLCVPHISHWHCPYLLGRGGGNRNFAPCIFLLLRSAELIISIFILGR